MDQLDRELIDAILQSEDAERQLIEAIEKEVREEGGLYASMELLRSLSAEGLNKRTCARVSYYIYKKRLL